MHSARELLFRTTMTVETRRRKPLRPSRAPHKMDSSARVLMLDVFAALRSNPRALLCRPRQLLVPPARSNLPQQNPGAWNASGWNNPAAWNAPKTKNQPSALAPIPRSVRAKSAPMSNPLRSFPFVRAYASAAAARARSASRSEYKPVLQNGSHAAGPPSPPDLQTSHNQPARPVATLMSAATNSPPLSQPISTATSAAASALLQSAFLAAANSAGVAEPFQTGAFMHREQIQNAFNPLAESMQPQRIKIGPGASPTRSASAPSKKQIMRSNSKSKSPRSDSPPVRRRVSVVPRQPKQIPDLLAEIGAQNVQFDNSLFRNTKGAPIVTWKVGSQPLVIPPSAPMRDLLTQEELETCATLRILPESYFNIKKTMLLAVKYHGPFKKREAQAWFRIDVNKICIIYDWFKALGWIPSATNDWAAAVSASSISTSSYSPSDSAFEAMSKKRRILATANNANKSISSISTTPLSNTKSNSLPMLSVTPPKSANDTIMHLDDSISFSTSPCKLPAPAMKLDPTPASSPLQALSIQRTYPTLPSVHSLVSFCPLQHPFAPQSMPILDHSSQSTTSQSTISSSSPQAIMSMPSRQVPTPIH